MTRTGRISGAGGSAAGLHAASRARIEKPSREAARAERTFLQVSECAGKGRSSVDGFAVSSQLRRLK
jgi:hypothetical protein